MTSDQLALTKRVPSLSISHVAERSHCYPGETRTLFTRVDVHTRMSGVTTRISLPIGVMEQYVIEAHQSLESTFGAIKFWVYGV